MNKILTSLIAALALNAGAADYITKYDSSAATNSSIVFPPNLYASIQLKTLSAAVTSATTNGTVTVYIPTGTKYYVGTNVPAGATNFLLTSTAGLVAGDALISVDTGNYPSQTTHGFTVVATNADLSITPGKVADSGGVSGIINTTYTLYQAKPVLVKQIPPSPSWVAPTSQELLLTGDALVNVDKSLPLFVRLSGVMTASKLNGTVKYEIMPR